MRGGRLILAGSLLAPFLKKFSREIPVRMPILEEAPKPLGLFSNARDAQAGAFHNERNALTFGPSDVVARPLGYRKASLIVYFSHISHISLFRKYPTWSRYPQGGFSH